MELLIYIGIFMATCVLMEGWAWASHKYILHGPLWFLHKTHHSYQPGWWEWNDLVSVAYGIAASVLIIHGIQTESYTLSIGLGISVYGIVYFVFHDVIIHQRIHLSFTSRNSYINRLIHAHKVHHRHPNKKGSEAFGFLYAPEKYNVRRKSS